MSKFEVGDKVRVKGASHKNEFVVRGVRESPYPEVNDMIKVADSDGVISDYWLDEELFELVQEKGNDNMENKVIKAYFRTKGVVIDGKLHRGNKVGKVIAFLDKKNSRIKVLYHFCDTRFDKYDEDFPMSEYRGESSVIPIAHRDSFHSFLTRATKYFKGVNYFNWYRDYEPKSKDEDFQVFVKSETDFEVIVQIKVPRRYLGKELVFRVGP